MKEIFDISIPVYDGMRTWPTVKPVRMKTSADPDFRSTRLNISTHTGTHVDYPDHMTGSKRGLPPERYFWGSVYLATPLEQDDQRQEITRLPELPGGIEGVIINTGHQILRGTDAEFDRFYGISLELAEELLSRDLKLIAIDSPSVEAMVSIDDATAVHKAILSSGTLVMENLDLTEVDDGIYELVVLPLKLDAVDGAPARAVLKR